MNSVGCLFFPKAFRAACPERYHPTGQGQPLGTWEECKTVTNELLAELPNCAPGCSCGWDVVDD
jgi:hypothetical protein